METKKLEFTYDEVFTLFYLFKSILNNVDDIHSLSSQNDFQVTLSRRDVTNLIQITNNLASVCLK